MSDDAVFPQHRGPVCCHAGADRTACRNPAVVALVWGDRPTDTVTCCAEHLGSVAVSVGVAAATGYRAHLLTAAGVPGPRITLAAPDAPPACICSGYGQPAGAAHHPPCPLARGGAAPG